MSATEPRRIRDGIGVGNRKAVPVPAGTVEHLNGRRRLSAAGHDDERMHLTWATVRAGGNLD